MFAVAYAVYSRYERGNLGYTRENRKLHSTLSTCATFSDITLNHIYDLLDIPRKLRQ